MTPVQHFAIFIPLHIFYYLTYDSLHTLESLNVYYERLLNFLSTRMWPASYNARQSLEAASVYMHALQLNSSASHY